MGHPEEGEMEKGEGNTDYFTLLGGVWSKQIHDNFVLLFINALC